MKSVLVFLAASLLLAGCSRKSADTPPNDGNVHNVSTNGLPFAVTVVETEQAKEWKRRSNLSLTYFEKHDYDDLEKLADEGRTADGAWPNGEWAIVAVYGGLELSQDQDDSVWLARQKAIAAWIQARPESITARVALAKHLTDYAWKARGTGYADTVSDEAERLFEERLRQAATVLKDARDLKAKCPVYWQIALEVALGRGLPRDRHDRLFQEAVEAWPDYQPICVYRGMFLLPRWHGEGGEWVDDLAKSADKAGGEKGDILYAQVAWCMKGYSSKMNIFEEYTNLSWERIDRGLTALENKAPDSLELVHMHAHMAALAGDGKTAKACLIKTQGKVTLSTWLSKGEFIDFANSAMAQ